MKIFHLPDLGEGLAEAEIREWYVKEGDTVSVDQPLVSVETAKALVDVPSPCEGRIFKLYGKAQDIIKTHAPLVEFEGGDKGSIVGKLEESQQPLSEAEVIIGAPARASAGLKILPTVRALAKQLKVDLDRVTPTGPKGQITAEDVKRQAQQSGGSKTEGEGLQGVRRAMATAMKHAHEEVAQMTLMDDVDLGFLPEEADLTALILQAMAEAAKAEPSLNAWFDSKTMQRQVFKEINVGLAMDTPEGLFVPVLKKVNELSAKEIREQINHFKETVRSRSLSPAEMQGATISLSNFGSMAGKYASPLVMPPTVAILGCGRIYEAPVVREGKIVATRLLPLSLSADHRVVTGGEVVRFLTAVKAYLEKKK